MSKLDIFSELDNMVVNHSSKLSEYVNNMISLEIRKYNERLYITYTLRDEINKLNKDLVISTDYEKNENYSSHKSFVNNCINTYQKTLKLFVNEYDHNKKILCEKISEILNHEYNLKLNINDYKIDDAFDEYHTFDKEVLLKKLLGDLPNMEDAKFEGIRKDFIDSIRSYSHWDCERNEKLKDKEGTLKAVLSKDKITFADYYYLETDWKGNKRLGWRAYEKLAPLSNALKYYFESKDIYPRTLSNLISEANKEYQFEYECQHYNFKIYKNNKVEIKFSNKKDAEDFYNMFRLNERVK